MPFTQTDLAKYPFLPKAQNCIKQLDLTIQELTETPRIIKHAEQRITDSFARARSNLMFAGFQSFLGQITDRGEKRRVSESYTEAT